jgi:hypothetical protein
MAERTLEERVAQLEKRLDELAGGKASKPQTPTKDWRRTMGMFRIPPATPRASSDCVNGPQDRFDCVGERCDGLFARKGLAWMIHGDPARRVHRASDLPGPSALVKRGPRLHAGNRRLPLATMHPGLGRA